MWDSVLNWIDGIPRGSTLKCECSFGGDTELSAALQYNNLVPCNMVLSRNGAWVLSWV